MQYTGKPSASNWRFRCTCSGRIFFPGALSSTKAMRPWGSSTNLSGIPSYPGETNLGQMPSLMFYSLYKLLFDYFFSHDFLRQSV
jgi:hypothetical protein